MVRSIEATREAKRLLEAKRRADPAMSVRIKAQRKARWESGGKVKQRAYLLAWRERHFFAWRARIFSMHYAPITAKQLALLWRQQRGRCGLTGRKLDRSAVIDHILPISRGGSHGLENLRWTTDEANHAKRDLTDEEFFALCHTVTEWIGRQIAAVLL